MYLPKISHYTVDFKEIRYLPILEIFPLENLPFDQLVSEDSVSIKFLPFSLTPLPCLCRSWWWVGVMVGY